MTPNALRTPRWGVRGAALGARAWAADDAPRDFEDNRSGWTSIAAGGCEIHVVPGTHAKMREEPHVQKLVEKLKPCLEKAQGLSI